MDDDSEFLLRVRPEIKNRYPFPDEKLNRQACEKSTENFARSRLQHGFADLEKSMEIEPDDPAVLYNPILDYYVKEYPLPIGPISILQCYYKHGWYQEPVEVIPSPIVERWNAFAGLAKSFRNNGSVGWFIGLVEVFDLFNNSEEENALLTTDEKIWLYHASVFKFSEGMILLEGKLDETVISNLKEYENKYNKTILGKTIPGRPPDDPEYWLYLFGKVVKSYPGITQRELAMRVHCHEKTIRYNLKKADFPNFKAFKKSILEQ